MPDTSNSDTYQITRRRNADNTPSSRAADFLNNSPTSPKIHELREKYLAKMKRNGLVY